MNGDSLFDGCKSEEDPFTAPALALTRENVEKAIDNAEKRKDNPWVFPPLYETPAMHVLREMIAEKLSHEEIGTLINQVMQERYGVEKKEE